MTDKEKDTIIADDADVIDVETDENDKGEAEAVEVVEEAVMAPVPEEEENDFVDDSAEKQAEERKKKEAEEAEKAKAEPPVAQNDAAATRSLRLAPEDEGGEPPVFIPIGVKGEYTYDHPQLDEIEKARLEWVKSYRIGSIIKISISMLSLAAIIIGWIVPSTVMGAEAGKTPLYVALGCAGGALVIMFITSLIIKNRNKGVIANYFRAFYKAFDAYAFEGLDVENLKGGVDDKITKEEFEAGKIFLNTHSVGSRDSLTFTYKGVDCALSDAAGQENRDDRTLGTSFVGKYLRAHNHAKVSEDGVVIYLKGNERAIPPSGILKRVPAIEEPRYNIYGSLKDIDAIPEEAMSKIKSIRTDKLLVDVTISIQKGRTYFYLGYEDTLMVLPNKEHFNPNYLISYKKHLNDFLDIAVLL